MNLKSRINNSHINLKSAFSSMHHGNIEDEMRRRMTTEIAPQNTAFIMK
jgi:hypothetical protein